MRPASLTILLIPLALAPAGRAGAGDPGAPDAGTASAPGIPAGWTAHPLPDGEDWDCANRGRDWEVARAPDGSLAITNAVGRRIDPLPFETKPTPTALSRSTGLSETDFDGDRRVVRVADGFIVGFNKGEFGGRAFWFSPDGERWAVLSPTPEPRRLQDYHPENVRALVPLGSDVLAFEGLAHLTDNEGQVLRLSRDSKGRWRATRFAALPGVPDVVVEERAGRWLVVTPTAIVRLTAEGKVRVLWSGRYLGTLYPSSGVRFEDGTIFVSMRFFVLRLKPSGERYTVDALVAPGCNPKRCACTSSKR
jgi:hypothetical protein